MGIRLSPTHRVAHCCGHAEVNLPFKESQVNDVLKSMVVLDHGKGRIGTVSYNSSAPPSARLAEIPFSIDAGTENDTAGGLAAVDARLAAADRETAEIGSDQDRLRENLKVLSEKSEARQLVIRYIAKAGEQDTRLEQIISERKAAAAERARLQSDLDSAIRALAVDRKL